MNLTFISRAATAVVMVIGLMLATPANAQWRKAETDRFVVYGNVNERDLHDYVIQLETFESLLRALHGLDMRAAPARRMEMYLVRDLRELRRISPNTGETTAGFYSASPDIIFGAAIHGREHSARSLSRQSRDWIMLHEYVHHFMLQHFPYSYPGWIVEGYAEYFMTARFQGDIIEIGHPMRATRGVREMPLETLLSHSAWTFSDSEERSRFYAYSWLLTHYLMSDDQRRSMLQAYLRAVADGADPVAAMEDAAGMSLDQLQAELRRHRLPITRYPTHTMPTPDITVTRLEDAANDLLLETVQLKRYSGRSENTELLDTVRSRTARHPDDLLARLALARAEVRLGDQRRGEALLEALLDDHPDNVEALRLLADSLMERAQEEPDDAARLNVEARRHLIRAYEADPGHYQTLWSIALANDGRRIPAPDPAMEAYLAALEIAPQVTELRFETAISLFGREQVEYGAHVLAPLLHTPHSPRTARYAQALLEAARAGRPLSSVRWTEEADSPPSSGDDEDTN